MTFFNKQKIISQLSNVPSPNVPPTIIWGNEVLWPVCVVSSTSVTVLPTDINMETVGSLEAGTHEETNAKSEAAAHLDTYQGNNASEDSPETELLHYIETLCDQPEFLSQVEDIIHPAFLDAILSPNRDIDFQTLIDELEQDENVLTLEPIETREHQSESCRPIVLSAEKHQQKSQQQDDKADLQSVALSPNIKDRGLMGKSNRRKNENAEKKRRRRKRTYSKELNELSKGVTSTVRPTRKSHSSPSSQKNILPQSPGRGNIKCSNNKSEAVSLWEPNLDATYSKITSVSNKTNLNHQNYQMTLNTSSGHPKRPCTSFDTVKLKSNKIISKTAGRKRQPFLDIKEELRNRPIVPLHQRKKQKTGTTSIHGHNITLIPYIKLMEVTNSTAGTRKTKEFHKSTQFRDCTMNNDVIVIDDEDCISNNDVIVIDDD